MKTNRKGFSLLEVLIGVLILSIICLFLFPSLYTNLDNSYKTKDMASVTFALQEAVETSRDKDFGIYNENINGKDIEIIVKKYQNPILKSTRYKKIKATYKGMSFELIEVDYEKSL